MCLAPILKHFGLLTSSVIIFFKEWVFLEALYFVQYVT